MSNKLDLNWHTFNDHILDNMKHLLSSNQFADVTLVCDDNVRIRAHSFVLSACSTVFSNLFNGESQSNATVFLKDIDQKDLSKILQFMYHGNTTFSVDRMESLIAASKSLEVKEISTEFNNQKEEATFCNDDQQNSKEMISELEITNHVREEETTSEQYIVTNTNITPTQPVSGKYVANSTRSNVCSDCERVFSSFSKMKKHYIKEHQGVTFPCDQCDNVYTEKYTLSGHKKGVHEGQRIKCEYEDCDKEFNFQSSYKDHVKKFHLNIKQYHNCSKCSYKSTNKTHLKRHIESKHEGLRFECNECGKQFSSKKTLEQHYSFFHDGITQKCSEENCNMEFGIKASLNRHIETVHHDFRYPCSACEYQATSVSTLKYHVETEHEGLRYECSECGKHFTQQAAVTRHNQTVHKGIKEHECNRCDFKTSLRQSLETHINAIHEQKQNYECDQCEFKTSHKSYLKIHIGIHEGKRFSCDECSKDFSTKNVLRKHKLASH